MPGRPTKDHGFYELTESALFDMASAHYEFKKIVVSGFSSWASSLHLVLCYAEHKASAGDGDVHIAVMDTQELEEEVNEEYLAYGRVAGRGYRAVKFADLKEHGLVELFPPLRDGSWHEGETTWQFGETCRARIFGDTPQAVADEDLKHAERVASLFGALFTPIFTALLSLRPRPWLAATLEMSSPILENLRGRIEKANCLMALAALKDGKWLLPEQVDTNGFPDVQQWIALLRALGQHDAALATKKKLKEEEKLAQKLKRAYARVRQAQESSVQSQTNSSADEQIEHPIDSTQQAISVTKAQAEMMDWKVVEPKNMNKKQKQSAKQFVKPSKGLKIP
ncbi:hypothetical protein N0V86_009839 [Didymella sp. IMI 355093]|nr:hypothetical protein N0V86_009839 [Didymella sp. IMI 355093]